MTGQFGFLNMDVLPFPAVDGRSYQARQPLSPAASAADPGHDLRRKFVNMPGPAQRRRPAISRESRMHVFDLEKEQEWNPKQHVEKILGKVGEGDVTVACWEPGQISPYHCHPHATEIYF